jgi:DNA-binding SARP family transcriptional activator
LLVDEPGCERIVADREYVSFDPKGTSIDLFEIRRELAGGANALSTQRLLEMAAQFRGELLEGLTIPDHQEFESWLLTERETTRRTRASILHVLVNRLVPEASASKEVLQLARDLVLADPYSITAHAMLIGVLSAAGYREEAERQHQSSMKEFGYSSPQELKVLNEALSPHRAVVSSTVVGQEQSTRLEQDIRFCSTSDGVRIAYASVGRGRPLIKTANWLNHLEYDWESPLWRHFFRALARERRSLHASSRRYAVS